MNEQEFPPNEMYEIVIGLVALVGTDLDRIATLLRDQAAKYHYQTAVWKLSEFLASPQVQQRFELNLHPQSGEYARLSSYMDAGNAVRLQTERNDFLALYTAARIHESRTNPNNNAPMPRFQTLHIVQSLKHPDEVDALRRIYGDGFFLFSIHCSEDARTKYLTERKGLTDKEASVVTMRDQYEVAAYGQRTREAFELGDIFLDYSDGNDSNLGESIRRAMALIFGSPFETPTQHEYAMFAAYAASLRSGSLSRQVGAAISNKDGDILAMGANDVPRFGGGQYWPSKDDQRDFTRGKDTNDEEKFNLARQLVKALMGQDLDDETLRRDYLPRLKATGLLDITEYGRDVHAEMEAIASCVRNGISIRGASLYTTTFPCHNCAKHMIAVGIERVYYVEPYPKSKALDLHGDAMALTNPSDKEMASGKVLLYPFVGVGPRRYFDLFSLRVGSGRPLVRKQDGKCISTENWKSKGPRVPLQYFSYLQHEENAVNTIVGLLDREISEPKRREP